ncbi:MAG: hypothetical protein M1115_00845 [Actinobacteria bacterium]|nr:hypothetical protein [Actinomycetota bacterium]
MSSQDQIETGIDIHPGRLHPDLVPRWSGQPDRAEVFYATLVEPSTHTGLWIHHEIVSPSQDRPIQAFSHGWVAAFCVGEAPVLERFGPLPARADNLADSIGVPPGEKRVSYRTELSSLSNAALELGGKSSEPSTANPSFDGSTFKGVAGGLSWHLSWQDSSPTLWTFPKWAWDRESLPAAQCVPAPAAVFNGAISVRGSKIKVEGARGAVAHIYGHGSAKRWAWLHGDLGGSDAIEIVAAVSKTPGLDHLPPLAFIQLRRNGVDWPRDPLVAAALFHTRIGLPAWSVKGTVGRRRLRVEVNIPRQASVQVGYVDPDGTTATCTNCEVADAEILLERRRSRWEIEARWTLAATAHAEVGSRP